MGKAAGLFNGGADQTLFRRVTPTLEQREFLQVQWNNLADHLKKALRDKYGYPISTWLQGSYKYGTLIRPVHVNEEYDVDVGVYFEWANAGDATPAPAQLRDWVQRELQAYGEKIREISYVVEPAKERCSRAIYEQKFHIDTPVYHIDSTNDSRRLACLSDTWENSDPKLIYKWFRDSCDGAEREQLRRLIRYLKGWAAVAFTSSDSSRPSSILLTVLATEAFLAENEFRFFALDDEDALRAVIHRVHDRVLLRKRVQNPIDKSENLNRIPDEYWDAFLTRFQTLRDAADHAEDCPDEATAALAWSEAFSFLMPLPSVQQVEVVAHGSQRAVMQVPDIDIRVFRKKPDEQIAQHRNEVPAVAKGCTLKFSIVNPHIIPEYATIEWTVRNIGEESDALGALGHRRMGLRMLASEESTSYAGLHYMDCVIRVGGTIYAVRRIPVNVKDLKYPPRNPAKPHYTKIQSARGRRG
jgi:hypothetical protein